MRVYSVPLSDQSLAKYTEYYGPSGVDTGYGQKEVAESVVAGEAVRGCA